MVDLLPPTVPSLSCFLNMVFARRVASLISPAASAQGIPSQDGMQRWDPASMSMVSHVVHPLKHEKLQRKIPSTSIAGAPMTAPPSASTPTSTRQFTFSALLARIMDLS
eukprot:GFKZ01013514.1.p3 GENE.GFKZ01013514.1~~GFKZ01013514.1.p3  ORF type:complete len:109 (+),score=8.92 GFKZ01013514.1:167-493(+)